MLLSARAGNVEMKTTVRLFARGKVTIPAQIRKELDIEDDDLVEIDVRPADTPEEEQA